MQRPLGCFLGVEKIGPVERIGPIYIFFPSLLTYGTAYESPEVGLSYESKIIAKLVLVAEILTLECHTENGPQSRSKGQS